MISTENSVNPLAHRKPLAKVFSMLSTNAVAISVKLFAILSELKSVNMLLFILVEEFRPDLISRINDGIIE
jgi:hypothetical protein